MVKPSLVEVVTWLWRSRWVQRYNSQRDAKMYDLVARYYFGRQKLALQISSVFLKYIKSPSQSIICDRAAGTGIITEALINAGFKVRASDISKDQLLELSARFKDVEIAEDDLNGLMVGVGDGVFDGLVAVAADRFMTTNGQEIFVQEARRVLKDRGILVWPLILGEYVGKIKHGLNWQNSLSARIKLLEKNGFKILSKEFKFNGISPAAICRIIVAIKL